MFIYKLIQDALYPVTRLNTLSPKEEIMRFWRYPSTVKGHRSTMILQGWQHVTWSIRVLRYLFWHHPWKKTLGNTMSPRKTEHHPHSQRHRSSRKHQRCGRRSQGSVPLVETALHSRSFNLVVFGVEFTRLQKHNLLPMAVREWIQLGSRAQKAIYL